MNDDLKEKKEAISLLWSRMINDSEGVYVTKEFLRECLLRLSIDDDLILSVLKEFTPETIEQTIGAYYALSVYGHFPCEQRPKDLEEFRVIWQKQRWGSVREVAVCLSIERQLLKFFTPQSDRDFCLLWWIIRNNYFRFPVEVCHPVTKKAFDIFSRGVSLSRLSEITGISKERVVELFLVAGERLNDKEEFKLSGSLKDF